MALIAVKKQAELGKSLVLAPERYDPRREMLAAQTGGGCVALAEVAASVRNTLSPGRGGPELCLVLDTSDTREGVVIGQKAPVPRSQIGSAKKVAESGDVIISRLRPYLRQVALVDGDVWNRERGVVLALSTEFYVLRSTSGESIAFLVPFLLSEAVQEVLAASQEGGHHPRFHESTLLGLPLPRELIERRTEISESVERAICRYREAERGIADSVSVISGLLREDGSRRRRKPMV